MKQRNWIAAALSVLLALAPMPALASQGSVVMPTSGTVSGLTLVNDLNSAFDAIQTCNSGATAPANSAGAAAAVGQCWDDTSGAFRIRKVWDGTSWLSLGAVDATNHVWTPPIGGGASAALTAAGTTDLGSVPQAAITINGATTITSFGSSAASHVIKVLNFTTTPQVTHNAVSMILLNGGSNIVAQAGDQAGFIYLGSGAWRELWWTHADGTAISSSSTVTASLAYTGVISPTTLAGNTNDWAPAGLASVTRIRATASTPVNVTGLTGGADGRVLILNNVGTNNITLTAQDASSSAANRFQIPRAYVLRPNESVTLVYDSTVWRIPALVTAQPTSGALKNLLIVNGGTPNNQMTVTADELVAEDGNGLATRLGTVSVTPDITSSGANGLDTGSVTTSQWYSIWVIYNPTTSTTAGMFSTSATAPTMPAGYTFKVRVGWNRTDGSSHFNRITQHNRKAQYTVVTGSPTAALPIISNTQSEGSLSIPTWVAKSVSNFVPTTASRILGIATATGSSQGLMVAPNNNYGAFNSSTNPPPVQMFAGGGVSLSQEFNWELETTNIYTANSFTGGATSNIQCLGWEDNI